MSITSTSGSASSSRILLIVLTTIGIARCTEPTPAELSGTFQVDGRFTEHVLKRVTPAGVTDIDDSVVVDSPVYGKVMFDNPVDIIESPMTVSLAACEYCLVTPGLFGSALMDGDSVKIVIGANPNLRFSGVFRGDTIAGLIESTQSGSGPAGNYVMRNRGAFVARRSSRDPTVTFTLRGLFDSVKSTNGQGQWSTATAVSDSLRGVLQLNDITTAPLGMLTAEKCGSSCFGKSVAGPATTGGYTGAGRRSGDSVAFTLIWDLTSRIAIRGVYKGDSIVGAMESSRSTSSTTLYSGAFVARRTP